MNQGQFDGDNGPNLYYTFTRCLRQEALTEWYDIIQPHQTDADRSTANFAEEIDAFIRLYEPRDTSELLQDQLNYVNHIFKPRQTKPSVFKNQLVRLNSQILVIPDTEEDDKFDDTGLKSIYFSTMPTLWKKKEFRKHVNKLSTQSIDELAQYFDIFHNESPNTSNTARNIDASTHNNSNQRNTNNYYYNSIGSITKPNSTSPRLKPEDVCPIHGGHTWHYCIFNKDGPNYRPPARNTTTTTSAKKSNDNFNDEQTRHETNDNDNTSNNPYDDDFKSVAPPNEPVPQVITEGISKILDEILIFKNCLLDSGGTKSLIPLSRLPKGLIKHQSS